LPDQTADREAKVSRITITDDAWICPRNEQPDPGGTIRAAWSAPLFSFFAQQHQITMNW
jgi:hypothetical protein